METNSFDSTHRWFDICHRNSVDLKAASQMCQKLIDAYSESHRYYHTLSHVIACLNLLDRVPLEQNERDLIEYAIWFHDVIYDVTSDSNEEESAIFAEKWLREQGLPNASHISLVINQTADYAIDPPSGRIEGTLLDLDLHILGTNTSEYQTYVANIRAEYSYLDDKDFFRGRRIFLESTLNKRSIFATDAFQELFEKQALNNINDELLSIENI